MPDQVYEAATRPLDELAASDPGGSAQTADAEEVFPDRRYGEFIDWLTLDPATIEGEKGPIEELRFYRENIEELLRSHKGQYVLIVDREIIAYFEDFESAGKHVERNFRGRSLLLKKVARFQPIVSFS
jgi:hypothetical protein